MRNGAFSSIAHPLSLFKVKAIILKFNVFSHIYPDMSRMLSRMIRCVMDQVFFSNNLLRGEDDLTIVETVFT